MTTWFDRHLITISLLPVYLLAFFFCPSISADNNLITKQIGLLEENFKNLSSEFYQQASAHTDERLKTISDINQLHEEVNRLIDNQHTITAIQLLYLNINTLKNNIEDKAIFEFTELLLKNNEWHLANTLLKSMQDEGDKSLLATMQFSFAKYHAERHQWPQVNTLLDGMITELSLENAAYANLLHSSALQHLKKHRLAITGYNKVPASSPYYAYAQLNIAIADIRQGWWTDAQTTINDLISNTDKDNSDELMNRIYLVLGYALLQKEYYREARDAFRHIGLDSRYTSSALLGIGLTATSQGDFVGGLNALSSLKDKKSFDLSVDESYLLIPYIYENLQQELTASASYTEAMTYFQQRIKSLEDMSKRKIDISTVKYDDKTENVIIENNSLDYGRHYPVSIIDNYRILKQYLTLTNDIKIKFEIEALITKHDSLFQLMVVELLKQRISFLKSYLNQSRYGLARLYDNSNETGE
jgi:hypothetical protein